ncbi:Uncharacterized protein DAT39_021989, partial [Clarias magur]
WTDVRADGGINASKENPISRTLLYSLLSESIPSRIYYKLPQSDHPLCFFFSVWVYLDVKAQSQTKSSLHTRCLARSFKNLNALKLHLSRHHSVNKSTPE